MSVVEAVWDPKPEVNGTAKTQNLEGRATQ